MALPAFVEHKNGSLIWKLFDFSSINERLDPKGARKTKFHWIRGDKVAKTFLRVRLKTKVSLSCKLCNCSIEKKELFVFVYPTRYLSSDQLGARNIAAPQHWNISAAQDARSECFLLQFRVVIHRIEICWRFAQTCAVRSWNTKSKK